MPVAESVEQQHPQPGVVVGALAHGDRTPEEELEAERDNLGRRLRQPRGS